MQESQVGAEIHHDALVANDGGVFARGVQQPHARVVLEPLLDVALVGNIRSGRVHVSERQWSQHDMHICVQAVKNAPWTRVRTYAGR